jgi:hypothetical protein
MLTVTDDQFQAIVAKILEILSDGRKLYYSDCFKVLVAVIASFVVDAKKDNATDASIKEICSYLCEHSCNLAEETCSKEQVDKQKAH